MLHGRHWQILQEPAIAGEAGNVCGSRLGKLYRCGHFVCVCLHHHDSGFYQCISYIVSKAAMIFGCSIKSKKDVLSVFSHLFFLLLFFLILQYKMSWWGQSPFDEVVGELPARFASAETAYSYCSM